MGMHTPPSWFHVLYAPPGQLREHHSGHTKGFPSHSDCRSQGRQLWTSWGCSPPPSTACPGRWTQAPGTFLPQSR